MKGLSTDIVYHIDACTVLLWVNSPPSSAMCCGLSSDDEVPAVGPRGGGCGVDRLRATCKLVNVFDSFTEVLQLLVSNGNEITVCL